MYDSCVFVCACVCWTDGPMADQFVVRANISSINCMKPSHNIKSGGVSRIKCEYGRWQYWVATKEHCPLPIGNLQLVFLSHILIIIVQCVPLNFYFQFVRSSIEILSVCIFFYFFSLLLFITSRQHTFAQSSTENRIYRLQLLLFVATNGWKLDWDLSVDDTSTASIEPLC